MNSPAELKALRYGSVRYTDFLHGVLILLLKLQEFMHSQKTH